MDILRSLKERCDPKYAALIVVDVQNDFVSPQGSAAKRGEDVSAAMAMVASPRASAPSFGTGAKLIARMSAPTSTTERMPPRLSTGSLVSFT